MNSTPITMCTNSIRSQPLRGQEVHSLSAPIPSSATCASGRHVSPRRSVHSPTHGTAATRASPLCLYSSHVNCHAFSPVNHASAPSVVSLAARQEGTPPVRPPCAHTPLLNCMSLILYETPVVLHDTPLLRRWRRRRRLWRTSYKTRLLPRPTV